jgi:hypothetical protein
LRNRILLIYSFEFIKDARANIALAK